MIKEITKEAYLRGLNNYKEQFVKMEKPIHAKPNLYTYFFEQLKVIAKEFGYNLVVHGSMNRDLDLIAIPWVESPGDEFEMIKKFSLCLTDFYSEQKEHYMFSVLPGCRNSYVINMNRSGDWNNYTDQQYYLDISVVQTKANS